MAGKLIVIEGLDGSGKSTQEELLKKKLGDIGMNVNFIKLPNYDDPACELVKMYLSGRFGNKPGDVNAYAASAFFAVDRVGSIRSVWKDKLNNLELKKFISYHGYSHTKKLAQIKKAANICGNESFFSAFEKIEAIVLPQLYPLASRIPAVATVGSDEEGRFEPVALVNLVSFCSASKPANTFRLCFSPKSLT